LETRDVADLGDYEHRDVAPDAADLAEDVDERVLFRARLDLARRLVDLAREPATTGSTSSPSRRVRRPR
jgi:hypothetical protein